ncbi:UTP--glucose-1-phosphate uridylyltransferase GalU [Scytonema sp. NUACC21]
MQKDKVRKAVIPAAGFGTRLFPATKVVKKELFPIIGKDGRAKPVILAIVEEAISAGIEEIGIVVQPGDRDTFGDFFKKPPTKELFNKLSSQNQEYCRYLEDLGSKITILTQKEQEGYGHAVFCAREWVKDETFLLMLGDHIYSSNTEKSCARQVLDVYEQANQSVVGLIELPATLIHKAGCVTGVWQSFNEILTLTEVCEKPTVEYARQNLRVEGITDERFLCIFGLYVLTPTVFDFLEEHIHKNFRERGEFHLTSCLARLLQDEGITGYVVKGKTFDIGLPDAYWQTMIDFKSC